ncbi:hypothetical protein [Sphingobacterium paucimobilis]|nr:hypothetical protein [Sphingobacterium paucimobilis]
MSIFFDSNITFLFKEEAITNSIIKTKRVCDLLTHQNESFGDLERAFYLCQQEHGHIYEVEERSTPLLLGIYLTCYRLFPSASGGAQLLIGDEESFPIDQFIEAKAINSTLSQPILECLAYLDKQLHDNDSREIIKHKILELGNQFRFHIMVKSDLQAYSDS